MTSRLRLRDTLLTGPRATIRRAGFIAVITCAAVAAIGYLLPAHRLVYVPSSGGYLDLAAQPGETSFHAMLADGGPVPLLALVVVGVLVTLLARSRRLGTGMLAGLVAGGGAVLAIAPLVLVHLFSRYESAVGEYVFPVAELGLFFTAAALVIAEPVLFLLERRRIDRASRPAPLPVARIASLA